MIVGNVSNVNVTGRLNICSLLDEVIVSVRSEESTSIIIIINE